jgi:hypothetical protein
VQHYILYPDTFDAKKPHDEETSPLLADSDGRRPI